jgi:thiol-disulfide isomerase/thioredoxin
MHLILNQKEDVTASSLKKLNELVMNKNTVLLNHASWCGHCHVLRPEWNMFKDENVRKVNVVEIEASALEELKKTDKKTYKRVTANDGVVYFPMIMVFVKRADGKTSQKKMYEGNRTAKDIKEYVGKKVKAAAPKKTPARLQKQEQQQKETEHEDHNQSIGGSMSLFTLNRELDMILKRLNMED